LLGWNNDLSISATVEYFGPAPGIYLRDTATGAQELAVPGEALFPELAGFAQTDERHLSFESESALVAGAVAGQRNLYDLDEGTLTLADRVPVFPATSCDDAVGPACVGSASGAFAGPYQWTSGNLNLGGTGNQMQTRESISADGSKVFFTQRTTGRLYMREDATRTVQVSATQRIVPDPNGEKGAGFVAATPSGSEVFFLSCEKLTDDATAVSTAPSKTCNNVNTQGQDLYVYDTASGVLTDLTVDTNAGDTKGAQVVGVVGVSADGSDVYFVANGVLAPGASGGTCTITTGEPGGACSLYLVHREGSSPPVTTFVARLLAGDLTRDGRNWTPQGGGNEKSSRVSADDTVLFTSAQKLTAYDNQGKRELYHFAPGDAGPTCISCNPTGGPPVGEASLQSLHFFTVIIPPTFPGFVTRSISADGGRVFFETPDKLVPADVNGDQTCPEVGLELAGKIPACTDVYEWEALGEGECTAGSPAFSAQNDGCLYLLSTGTSTNPSFFGDADVEGNNAFFFTTTSLVPQDQDQLYDVYDASVGGGLAYQHATPAVPCEGEGCRGQGSNPANNPGAGSSTFQGPGNPKANRQRKKRKHHKKKRQHKRAHAHKRANANQGGAK
jgi:hypothetical protein